MAKQKNRSEGKNPKLKPANAKSAPDPIRVRSTHEQADAIRQKALKDGAASVATMVVGPNQVETTAVFAKKAAASVFSKWLQSSRNVELVENATEGAAKPTV
ncbi:MAG: hypothetical protein J6J36_08960 [Clostridia bacterium]|nr:hypothetical protein [Clostridia bacterium]